MTHRLSCIALAVALSISTGPIRATDRPAESSGTQTKAHDAKTLCHYGPDSEFHCAGTGLPSPSQESAFWEKLLSVIQDSQGYVTIEQFEQIFDKSLTRLTTTDDGYRAAYTEGRNINELSARLDVYSGGAALPLWRKFQGESNRGHSVLNMTGGDFGCFGLLRVKQLMEEAKLEPVGSIDVPISNIGKSSAAFIGHSSGQVVTVFYTNGSITAPCVESIRIVGYEPARKH